MPTHDLDALPPDVRLKELHIDENGTTTTWHGDGIRMFAEWAIEWFKQEGGINYVTLDVHRVDKGWYTLTMQKKGGVSPGDDLARGRALAAMVVQAIRSGDPLMPLTEQLAEWAKC